MSSARRAGQLRGMHTGATRNDAKKAEMATLRVRDVVVDVSISGLTQFSVSGGGNDHDSWSIRVQRDAFSAQVHGTDISKFTSKPTLTQISATEAVLTYPCSSSFTDTNVSHVNVTYRLNAPPDSRNAWITKTVTLIGQGSVDVGIVAPLASMTFSTDAKPSAFVMHSHEGPNNPYGVLDVFAAARYSADGGFRSVVAVPTNPFSNATASTTASGVATMSLVYNVTTSNIPLPYSLDAMAIGIVSLLPAKAYLPYTTETSAHNNERQLVADIADSMRTFSKLHQTRVHVDWTEDAYQLDVATESGFAEYDRVLRACQRLNITHAVSSPRNGDLGTRANATDWWGWEEVLWLGFGEWLRKGIWDARSGPVPDSTKRVLDAAQRSGVKLLAYVYPILGFLGQGGEKSPAPWIYCLNNRDCKGAAPGEQRWAALADPRFQAYLLDALGTFMDRFQLGGFSWDFTFLGLDTYHSTYATWRGWMNVLAGLRERYPAIVMDHRQSAHSYGPFYWLYGSYSEPIMEDEQPETYGVRIADLSTDRVSASNLRYRAYELWGLYFSPADTISGFIGHLTERFAANGTLYWSDANIRDFDILGFEHSVLSSIAVAPRNILMNMVPARDQAEFDAFPSTPLTSFFHKWTSFAAQNLSTLLRYRPLWPLFGNSPALGHVDGVAAASPDASEIFMFLFNPGHASVALNLTWDSESLDVPCSPDDGDMSWKGSVLYPIEFTAYRGIRCGSTLSMELAGTTARVLKFEAEKPRPSGSPPVLSGMPGDVAIEGSTIRITGAYGEFGMPFRAIVSGLPDSAKATITTATVNQENVNMRWEDGNAYVWGIFKGRPFRSAQALGPPPPAGYAGLSPLKGSSVVPSRIFAQMQARANSAWGKIPWTSDDYNATWLQPARLLVYVMPSYSPLANPWAGWCNVSATLRIGTRELQMSRAYNSRSRAAPNTFTGIYADVTSIWEADVDVEWQVTFDGPRNATTGAIFPPDSIDGIYFANVETAYTSDVV